MIERGTTEWSVQATPTAGGGWIEVLRSRRPRRRPAAALAPVIYRWDLDKTYLKSDFESLRKMMRVPFERAEDKIDEPGVVALMRALRASARAEGRKVFVYFISASPPQIGRAIREKLTLDGIEIDGIIFKDQLQHLVRGRFRFLREQIGFKLAELLKARLAAPPGAAEYLFGDDWESDSLCYSLYADVVSGHLDNQGLGDILVRLRIDPARLVEIRALARRVNAENAVRRIFINLERRTPPGRFRAFGTRLVPTFNYFQTALVLHEEGMVPLAAVVAVGHSLIDRAAYTRGQLRNSLDDLVRRGHLHNDDPHLRRDLEEAGVLPSTVVVGSWSQRLWRRLRRRRQPPRVGVAARPAAVIDYPRLVDAWLASGGRPGETES
jgi:hypothetical protein